MEKQKHLLPGFWKNYPNYIADKDTIFQTPSLSEHLADILAIGPFYYYIIQLSDYSLHYGYDASAILATHGIDRLPETLQHVVELIHPDDFDYVAAAEEIIFKKIKEIGFRYRFGLKTSYCFRMRTADGSYHLFHHQSVPLAKDDNGHLSTVLHVHTDIQHITPVNNNVVLVNGIGGQNDYHRIDLATKNPAMSSSLLSKREKEILTLLAQGLSSAQIGKKLFIAEETVRVHRKRLLKKTQTTNSSNLIKKCLELRLL